MITQKYKQRHKILQVLDAHVPNKPRIHQREMELSVKEIAERAGLPENQVDSHLVILWDLGHVKAQRYSGLQDPLYSITPEGQVAYHDDFHLTEGRQARNHPPPDHEEIEEDAYKLVDQSISGWIEDGEETALKDSKNLINAELEENDTAEGKRLFLGAISKWLLHFKGEHEADCPHLKRGEKCPTSQKYDRVVSFTNKLLEGLPLPVSSKAKRIELPKLGEGEKVKACICYGREDKGWLARLKKHFGPLKRHIELWDDSLIEPGLRFKEEIIEQLKGTQVVVVLVSSHLLDSEFFIEEELPVILEMADRSETKLLAILVNPCLFEYALDLEKFQFVNPLDRPVSEMLEPDQERVWTETVKIVLQCMTQ